MVLDIGKERLGKGLLQGRRLLFVLFHDSFAALTGLYACAKGSLKIGQRLLCGLHHYVGFVVFFVEFGARNVVTSGYIARKDTLFVRHGDDDSVLIFLTTHGFGRQELYVLGLINVEIGLKLAVLGHYGLHFGLVIGLSGDIDNHRIA